MKQISENEVGRIVGDAIQLPNGQWRPTCEVTVFRIGIVGSDGETMTVPTGSNTYQTGEEAARQGLDIGLAWFKKNVPTNI